MWRRRLAQPALFLNTTATTNNKFFHAACLLYWLFYRASRKNPSRFLYYSVRFSILTYWCMYYADDALYRDGESVNRGFLSSSIKNIDLWWWCEESPNEAMMMPSQQQSAKKLLHIYTTAVQPFVHPSYIIYIYIWMMGESNVKIWTHHPYGFYMASMNGRPGAAAYNFFQQ